MRISLFDAKMNAELPDSWFNLFGPIRFAVDPLLGAQLIDFKSRSGKVLAFWLTNDDKGEYVGNWKEIEDQELGQYSWSDEATFLDPWAVARTLGYSNKTLNLTSLGNKRATFEELMSVD